MTDKNESFFMLGRKSLLVFGQRTALQRGLRRENHVKEKSVQQTRPIRRGRQSWVGIRKSGSEALFG